MAVKFPLEMKDGVQVRNISELKKNFDIEKVVGYFLDGKLKKWLDARWYEDESDAVSKLDENDPLLAQRLCEIFEVEYVESKINTEEITTRNERITKLKQYTDDENILKNIDSVAFTQEDLTDLWDKKTSVIYLCGEIFEISLSQKSILYVGINKPIVVIPAQEAVEFEKFGIQFKGIMFEAEYQKIMLPKLEKAIELHRNKQYDKAKVIFEKHATKGNAEAMWYLGFYYKNGYGTEADIQKSYEWYLKGAEAGDSDAMNSVAICYEEGRGTKEDRKKAAEWYKKGAEAGQMYAMYNWARCCENGIGVSYDSKSSIYWYEKSAEAGHSYSMGKMADYYRSYEGGKDYDKTVYWAIKGAEEGNERSIEVLVWIYNRSAEYDKVFSLLEPKAQNGDVRAMITLYDWYSTGRVVLKPYRNYRKALQWLRSAAEAGDVNSMNRLGNLYNGGNRDWGVVDNISEARKWWAKADSSTKMWSSYDK